METKNSWTEQLRVVIDAMAESFVTKGQKFAVKDENGEIFINIKVLQVATQLYLQSSLTSLARGKDEASDTFAKVSLFLSGLMDKAEESV